jgi:hypothetical protein
MRGVSLEYYDKPQFGYIGWVEPVTSSWILWFRADGSAVLYTERETNGAVKGKPTYLNV